MTLNDLEQKEWTSYHTFLIIFLSVFNFGYYFIIVYTGLILPEIASTFHLTTPSLAGIFSIIGLGTILSFFTRTIPDRIGRKPSLLIITAIFVLNICLSAISIDLIMYIIFQFISGIFSINICNVIIAEEVPAKDRAKISGIVVSIGMLSSLLASFLITINIMVMWRYYYLLVNIPVTIIFGILWLKMKETKRFIYEKTRKVKNSSLFNIFSKKYLKILILLTMILLISQCIYSTGVKRYYTVFLFEEKGFNPISIGTYQPFRNDFFIGILSMFSFIGSIIGYLLSGYFGDIFGRKKTIYVAATTNLICQLIFIFSTKELEFLLSMFFINLTFSIFHTCVLVFSVEFWPTAERSKGSGTVTVFSSLAGTIGNLLVYYLASEFSWGSTFLVLSVLQILLVIFTKFIPETKHRIVEEILQTEIEKKV